MSRWHRESCSNPVIVIKQRVPNCKSCNSSPDLEALISSQSSENLSPSSVPSDEPYGQLNLWWPPAVPYQSTSLEARRHVIKKAAASDPVAEDNHNPGGNSSTHVYVSQLSNDEFRLLRLTSVADVDDPVHVDLETHNDERHPDYETVSYTWGGEDGDSTLCQPIYVGDHWDILLQTRNCWDMVRCLRPRRDSRRVWVDAICIDQHNFRERGLQVSKMSRIFAKAIRTVVYLGPDLASPTSTSSPYPRRKYIQELLALPKDICLSQAFPGCPGGLTAADLLKREYFQRLWVIQELMVSRDVTFVIGDVEFTIIRRLGDPPSLEQPPYLSLDSPLVPWLKHATQQVIGDSTNELLAAVDLAHYSKATDPRDKIYGVFGMTRKEKELVPSYSISFQHVAIGYFAYCLTVNKDIRVLSRAAGLRAADSMPSWAPSILTKMTRSACAIPRLGTEKDNTMYDSMDFSRAYAIHHRPPSVSYQELNVEFPPPASWRYFRKWSPVQQSQTCSKVTCGQEAYWLSNYLRSNASSPSRPIRPTDYWHSQIKVDRSTGTLMDIKALHILCFGNLRLVPTEIHRNGKIHTYVFQAGESSVIVHADKAWFKTSSGLSQTHLFALYDDSDEPAQAWYTFRSRICVLRSTSTKDTFRLVSASVDVCFHSPYSPAHSYDLFSNPNQGHDSWYELRHSTHTQLVFEACSPVPLPMITQESLRSRMIPERQTGWYMRRGQASPLDRVECLHIESFDTTLARLLEHLKKAWVTVNGTSQDYMRFLHRGDPASARLPWLGFAFPGVTNPYDFLRVTYSVFVVQRGDEGAVSSFFDTYFETVRNFKPRVFEAPWLQIIHQGASGRWSPRRKDWRGERNRTMIQLCFEGRDNISKLEDIISSLEEPWQWHHVDRPEEHPDIFAISWGGKSIFEIYKEEIERHGYRPKDTNLFVYIRDETSADGVKPLVEFLHQSFPRYRHQYLSGSKKKGEDKVWIAFDLQTLILWAQTHPCIPIFQALTPYCREGESELGLLLRDPLPEDADIVVPKWPQHIIENFGIGRFARMRKINIA